MFGLSKILCAKAAPKTFAPKRDAKQRKTTITAVKRPTRKVDLTALKAELKKQTEQLQGVVKQLDTLKQERLKEFPERKDNLYDMLFRFPNKGVGLKFTRSIWRRPECFWTITDVKFTKQHPEVKRGKAIGILTWRGVAETEPRLISGHFKREWHEYDPEFIKKFEDKTKWIQNQSKPRGSHTWKQLEEMDKTNYRYPPVA